MKLKYLAVIGLLIAGFAAGWYAHSAHSYRPPAFTNKERALPRWANSIACTPPTESEAKQLELVLTVLDAFGHKDGSLSMVIGAQRFLSSGPSKGVGRDNFRRLCTPVGYFDRVAETMKRHDMWRYRITDYQVDLARQIGEPRPEIIAVLSEWAFKEYGFGSSAFKNKDMRPIIRTALAEYGPAVSHLRDVAFPLISSADSLGTGAAQVAAAAGHPDALPVIVGLMEEIMDAEGGDGVISKQNGLRLQELVYAIAYAEEAGLDYLKQVQRFMNLKVEDSFPTLGSYEADPVGVCDALKRMGSGADELRNSFEYCKQRERRRQK